MKKSKLYPEPAAGEWVQPSRKGYKMQCCDCGLVHRFEFRYILTKRGITIQFRGSRDQRATAAVRRWRIHRSKELSGWERRHPREGESRS